MACQEGNEFVDACDDILGHAEVGEAVVRVVDASGGGEVRLEPAKLDLERLVEEGAVVPRGDAQDVGIVRGRRDFIDVGERVHEPTQVVHLAFGRAPAFREVDALFFEVGLGRGCAEFAAWRRRRTSAATEVLEHPWATLLAEEYPSHASALLSEGHVRW